MLSTISAEYCLGSLHLLKQLHTFSALTSRRCCGVPWTPMVRRTSSGSRTSGTPPCRRPSAARCTRARFCTCLLAGTIRCDGVFILTRSYTASFGRGALQSMMMHGTADLIKTLVAAIFNKADKPLVPCGCLSSSSTRFLYVFLILGPYLAGQPAL